MTSHTLLVLIYSSLILSTTVGLLTFNGERRLSNVQQLTFDGLHSKARFGLDDDIVFQGRFDGGCDQVYRLDLSTNDIHQIGTGIGETSHADSAGQDGFVFGSTFHHSLPWTHGTINSTCPTNSCGRKRNDVTLKRLCKHRNLKQLHPEYDIFLVNRHGNIRKQLTRQFGYDSEPAISADGQWIVYTSTKSGDTELWRMNRDGGDKKRLTHRLGYEFDGRWSPSGKQIVFAATTPSNHKKYWKMMHYNLVKVSTAEIFLISADGKDIKQVTNLGGLSRNPEFVGEDHILFSSNHHSVEADAFDLFLVRTDGTGVEQITHGHGHINKEPSVKLRAKSATLTWISSRNSTFHLASHTHLFMARMDLDGLFINPPPRPDSAEPEPNQPLSTLHYPQEKHLANVQQLTFGGQNAEGYFSFDSTHITLQATGVERYGTECDQIYKLRIAAPVNASTPLQRVSTGLGACTCSYFFPDDQTLIYASTFAAVKPDHLEHSCPTKRCKSEQVKRDATLRRLCNTSYTWDLFADYDIYKVNRYGNILKRLTNSPGYDAEGAVSPDGKRIVFTSLRSGDPELWLMDADGGNLRQLTNQLGYDGGPFFSPDGTKVVFRASRPKTAAEVQKYKQLLSYDLVEPLAMELHTVNLDGTGLRQLTALGGSNWAPFYLLDNDHVLFSTNFNQSGHFGAFDLYKVTYNQGGFDAFPMQSRNGKKLVWGSSRNGATPFDLNLFLADWI